MTKNVQDELTVVRERVALQGFTKLVGAGILELAPGHCRLSVPRRAELLQNCPAAHGGVIAFLVDNATTMAASTTGTSRR
ncbi:PaaI family thioesterase [Bradyrhizobium sp. USDA 4502]